MYEKYKELKIERRGGVLTVTIDNPPMNPSTTISHRELSQIFEEINHDHETKVVVITGAGDRAFSAGGDINNMIRRVENNDYALWNEQAHEAKHIVYGLMRLEKPLIARINGHAMGLGATIAAFADISFMMAKAKIADTHVNVGLTAGDGGSLIWPFLVGFNKARYHLLTGEPLTGAEAAQAGLVTKAVDTIEELDKEVYGLAEKLANGPTMAINTTKIAMSLVLRNVLEGLVENHMGLETQTAFTADHLEAGYAFRDRREPKFTGR